MGPQGSMQIDGTVYDVPAVRSGQSLGKSWARIWLTSTFDLNPISGLVGGHEYH